MQLPRDDDGKLSEYAWPGGYPLFYLVADGGTLCPKCAREADEEGLTQDKDDPQWYIVDCDVNWEDEDMWCDHCGEHITSAYGND